MFAELSLEQVDCLWNCLAEDTECADDCFNWFLNQVKSKDQHAMSYQTFKHIFIEKVKPRPISMSIIRMDLLTMKEQHDMILFKGQHAMTLTLEYPCLYHVLEIKTLSEH